MDLAEMYVIKQSKLGTQSKLSEQNYSQIILAIYIKYIWFKISLLVNHNKQVYVLSGIQTIYCGFATKTQ